MTALDFERAAAVHLANLQRWLTSEHERVAKLREQALTDRISALQKENLNLRQTPAADRERVLEDRISCLQKENLELRQTAPPTTLVPASAVVPVVAGNRLPPAGAQYGAWPDLVDPAYQTDAAAVLTVSEEPGVSCPDRVLPEQDSCDALPAIHADGEAKVLDAHQRQEDLSSSEVDDDTNAAEAQKLLAQAVLEEALCVDVEAEQAEKARSLLESMLLTGFGEAAAQREAQIALDEALCDEPGIAAAKCEARAALDLALVGEPDDEVERSLARKGLEEELLHGGTDSEVERQLARNWLEEELLHGEPDDEVERQLARNKLEERLLQSHAEQHRMMAYRRAALAMAEQEVTTSKADRQERTQQEEAMPMLGKEQSGEQPTEVGQEHLPINTDSRQLTTMSKASHNDDGGSNVLRRVESTERQGQPATRGLNHPYLVAVLQDSSSQVPAQETGERRDGVGPAVSTVPRPPQVAPSNSHRSPSSCSKDRRPMLSASTSATGSATPSPSARHSEADEKRLPVDVPANSRGALVPPPVAGSAPLAKPCRSPAPENTPTAHTPRGTGSVVSELRKARMAAARHRSQPPRR